MGNYYNLEINLESDYYEKFDNTPFGLSIFLLQLTLLNLERFNAEGITKKPLIRLKTTEFSYNQKDFCISVNNDYYNYLFPNRDYLVHFKDLAISSKRCITIGNGINKGGLKTGLETIFNELIESYIEFINDYKKNNTESIWEYLFNPNILNLFVNLDYPVDKAEMVYIKLVEIENDEIFKNWKVIENDFIYAFLSFDLLVVLVVFFIMKKLGAYYFILYDTVNSLHTDLKIK
jgi:hypothetical protein